MIDDHYAGEAQTLTTGAEQNLLKLAELRGRLTAEQAQRAGPRSRRPTARRRPSAAPSDDPMTRAVGAVGLLADRVSTAIEHAADRLSSEP